MTAPSHQLPSSIVAAEFGEVNVRDTSAGREVRFTILMEPQGVDAEGWQTGVALDASASMRNWYGRGLLGKVPPELAAEYEQKGWLTKKVQDGKSLKVFQTQAYDDAIRRGHLKLTENIVQPTAREFTAYLASNLDADGGTTLIYWACGDGTGYEVVGDFTSDQCATLELSGPKLPFGVASHLTPAVRYFAERFADAKNGMYVFITDGGVTDLEEVKKYTIQLCRDISAKKRNPLKCVLIGVGNQIDEKQMEELDDLDSGTEVDIWDHKIAKEMRAIVEIFAEVVGENQIVAPTGTLLDSTGNTVVRFTDGVPALIEATLPAGCPFFELEVGDQRVRQPLTVP